MADAVCHLVLSVLLIAWLRRCLSLVARVIIVPVRGGRGSLKLLDCGLTAVTAVALLKWCLLVRPWSRIVCPLVVSVSCHP